MIRTGSSPRVGAAALAAAAALALTGASLTAAPESASATEADSAPGFAAPTQRVPDDFAAPTLSEPAVGAESAPEAAQAEETQAAAERPAGIGEKTFADLPEGTSQLLVAAGESADSTSGDLELWERGDDGWELVRSMPAHNGSNGWLADRREGDRTSPEGVFSLSDAGGFLDDPGAKLPYTQDGDMRSGAAAVYGDDYTGVFDYVIAVDYNRKPGTPPTDNERPMGWDAGGKIWLHVDHNKPTRGCVTVSLEDMEYLVTHLDPAKKPHIAMGEAAVLAR